MIRSSSWVEALMLKNTYWGSRFNTPKGNELYKAIFGTGCEVVSR